jgi:hypothetical protein
LSRIPQASAVAWAIILVLLALLFLVPIAGQATVCVDDFAWIKLAHATPRFWTSLMQAWSSYFFFRPLDILTNWFISPSDLRSAPILPFQAAGLVALMAAVWRLTKALMPATAMPALIAWIWLLLHPATQLSLWASGATSQTWSAAIGMWLLCHVLLEHGNPRSSPRHALRVAALSSLGILCKELFVGWASAAALVVLARSCRLNRLRRPSPPWALSLEFIAILAPPALWIALRMATSEFGRFAEPSAELHYSFQGPRTVIWNASLATLGMFVQGPIHWARLLGFPWKLVPLAGAFLSFVLAVYGGRLPRPDRAIPDRGNMLAGAVLLGLVSLWPALAIRQVSEIYMMGPNALIAVLVGAGAGAVTLPQQSHAAPEFSPPRLRQGLRMAIMALLVIATIGFASRTHHFTITWNYARTLRAAALDLIAREGCSGPIVIVLDRSLVDGPVHSKYFVPPALAADLPNSFRAFRLAGVNLPPIAFRGDKEDVSAVAAQEAVASHLQLAIKKRKIW